MLLLTKCMQEGAVPTLSDENKAMSIYLPREMWFEIRTLALSRRESVSATSVWLLEKALADTFVPDDVTQETPA